MNVIDSSGWLEYFADDENDFFAPAIKDYTNVIVPVICIYEMYKVTRENVINHLHWKLSE